MTFKSYNEKKKNACMLLPSGFALTRVHQLFLKKKRKKPKFNTEEILSCFHVSFLGENWFQTVGTLIKDENK